MLKAPRQRVNSLRDAVTTIAVAMEAAELELDWIDEHLNAILGVMAATSLPDERAETSAAGDASTSGGHLGRRAMKRRPAKGRLREMRRLFERCGVVHSSDPYHVRGEYLRALHIAALEGWLKVPPLPGESNRGAPGKWKGRLGIELLAAIEYERIAKAKHGKRRTTVAAAIRALRDERHWQNVERDNKWGRYGFADLHRGYYSAKKFWGK